MYVKKKKISVGVTEIRESFARLKSCNGLGLGRCHARPKAQLDAGKCENAVWLYIFPLRGPPGQGLPRRRWSAGSGLQAANVTRCNCLTNPARALETNPE